MTLEDQPAKYPDAISRKFGEGGYTMLHRVFEKNIRGGKPVVIDSGGNYIQYSYDPEHDTFEEGIKILEGDEDGESYEAFMSVASSFDLKTAIDEGGFTREDLEKSAHKSSRR